MSARFAIPEWLGEQSAPPLPPVDDHRVEGLVNRFIAGKQEALFTAPDAFYRQQGGDALAGAPAIADRLQALRTATLDQARDDGERAALGPRLDLHVADALDGIDRHVDAQRTVHQRQVLAERQRLIRRAAELEPDNDDKIDGLAEAQASAAQALARLDGIAPDSPEDAAAQANARSQILRAAIEQRIGSAMPDKAVTLYDRVKAALSPADRQALELPLGVATDEAAADAWLAREAGRDGTPLADRVGLDDTLSAPQRLILRAKIGARESAEESRRFATVKGLDDQLAAATVTLATQPSRYRPGALAQLAEAYADAGAPEKADETRRLALWERYFLPFTQAGAAAQQRHLQELTGPERAMADAIVRHQDDAFSHDPYAAGTALYPEVGPALPEEDAEGRLRQARMIEAMRGTPTPSKATAEMANVQSSITEPGAGLGVPQLDRVWTDEQSPAQGADPNLFRVADEPESGSSSTNDGQQQAQAKPNARRTPPSTPPAQPDPAVAERNRQTIDRLANSAPDPKWKEGPLPGDWESRLPKATLDALEKAEKDHGVPRELLAAVLWKESKFDEKATQPKESAGRGIASVTPGMIDQLIIEANKRGDSERAKQLREWQKNDSRMQAGPAISMAAEYLRYSYKVTGQTWPTAVAGYNFGTTGTRAFIDGYQQYDKSKEWKMERRLGELTAYLPLVFNGDVRRFDRMRPTP